VIQFLDIVLAVIAAIGQSPFWRLAISLSDLFDRGKELAAIGCLVGDLDTDDALALRISCA
jgi:hypothetical protein